MSVTDAPSPVPTAEPAEASFSVSACWGETFAELLDEQLAAPDPAQEAS